MTLVQIIPLAVDPRFSPTLPVVVAIAKTIGIIIGWVIFMCGIALAYNSRYVFPRIFPALFYSFGIGLMLIANRGMFGFDFQTSTILILLGYLLITVGVTCVIIWLMYSDPPQWRFKHHSKR